MISATRARVLLERIRTRAEASPEVLGLLLFGSLATGTDDAYSDVDIGLYIEDRAFETFDLRRWLEPVGEVAAIHTDPYCSTVIFADLRRAEIHLGPSGAATEAWPPLAGVIAFPSLERMVLLDRTGRFREAVAPLVGRLPARGVADGEQALLGLANWLIVADGCRRRGDLARSLTHLGAAHPHLLRLARLAEAATDEWIAPERGLVTDLSPGAYARYAAATAWLDAEALRSAIDRSWRWGRDLANAVGAHPLAAPILERLDRRLCVRRRGDGRGPSGA